ncbi:MULTISPECIES: mechanosensitive ion channel [unclassified Myroides]|uniref:mechanosensitive ion channel family protein n=1 Tax=unclassified Myroides TaxID=2642485 RepID=UPI002577C6C7|nr:MULTISPECIES: mechanosensitive ion channel [unclassified Myroides]
MMEKLYSFEYPSEMINDVMNSLIKGVFGFLLIAGYVLLCWLMLKLFSYILKKMFKLIRLDKIQEGLDDNEFLSKVKIRVKVDAVLLFFVKVFLVFLMVLIGAELFGLEIVSREIGNLMMFVPKLFVALLIFIGGLYFASWIKKVIVEVLKAVDFVGARMIGNILFYLILIFVVITTLNQMGIDTSIITSNISIIIGAILLTVALSLGLGAKDVVTKLLYSFYARKNLEIGQYISIDGLKGYVISIDNIYLCLLVEGKKNYIPIKTVSESHIEILK